MVAYDITERVISYLGQPPGVAASWANSDFNYDYAIAGIPFLSAANDSNRYTAAPYSRSFIPVRKDQIDQQPTPGEQSLAGWWLRSQSNWTGGAGIKFLEPTSDERIMRSFKDSLGVDCWTAGQLSLLNATTTGTERNSQIFPVAATTTVDYVYGTTMSRSGVTTALTGSGTNHSVVENGTHFFRLASDGLYAGLVASGGDALYYTTSPARGVLGWVKGRLMAAVDNSIYELTASLATVPPAASTALPAALYTHPVSGFIWRSFAEGPNAIYAAGTSGRRSSIFKFTLDQTMASGSLPALSQGTVAAELPTGELILHIATYLGRYMGVSTNRGFRVAVIDGNGDLSYGPLIWTDASCYWSVGDDRFLYVGTELSSGAGLIRVDLSDPDDAGRFPYATDLQSGVSGYAYRLVLVPGTSRKVFVAFASGGAGTWTPVEESTSKVSSGWIRSGQVRYSTLEPKHFELLKVRWQYPMPGSVGVAAVDANGVESTIMTLTSDLEQDDMQMPSQAPAVSVGVRLDLSRSGSDATAGPTVTGWQLKAVPAAKRKEMVQVPLLCFDFQRDTFKAQCGYAGFALDRYRLLRDTVREGDVVTFQDLSSDEELKVVVEQISFEQFAPPGVDSGFGGIVTVEMREV